jgi:hypothetical protein
MTGLRKTVNLAIFALVFGCVFFDVAETPPMLALVSHSRGCEAAGGKWANAQDRCFTRACLCRTQLRDLVEYVVVEAQTVARRSPIRSGILARRAGENRGRDVLVGRREGLG